MLYTLEISIEIVEGIAVLNIFIDQSIARQLNAKKKKKNDFVKLQKLPSFFFVCFFLVEMRTWHL